MLAFAPDENKARLDNWLRWLNEQPMLNMI